MGILDGVRMDWTEQNLSPDGRDPAVGGPTTTLDELMTHGVPVTIQTGDGSREGRAFLTDHDIACGDCRRIIASGSYYVVPAESSRCFCEDCVTVIDSPFNEYLPGYFDPWAGRTYRSGKRKGEIKPLELWT